VEGLKDRDGDAAGFGWFSLLCSEEGKFPASAKVENVLSHVPEGKGDGAANRVGDSASPGTGPPVIFQEAVHSN